MFDKPFDLSSRAFSFNFLRLCCSIDNEDAMLCHTQFASIRGRRKEKKWKQKIGKAESIYYCPFHPLTLWLISTITMNFEISCRTKHVMKWPTHTLLSAHERESYRMISIIIISIQKTIFFRKLCCCYFISINANIDRAMDSVYSFPPCCSIKKKSAKFQMKFFFLINWYQFCSNLKMNWLPLKLKFRKHKAISAISKKSYLSLERIKHIFLHLNSIESFSFCITL